MFHLSLGQFLDCNRRCQVSTHHLQTIVVIAVVTSVICWRSSLPEFDTTYSFLVLHNVSCMTLYGLIESLFSPPMITSDIHILLQMRRNGCFQFSYISMLVSYIIGALHVYVGG